MTSQLRYAIVQMLSKYLMSLFIEHIATDGVAHI
jgi:hypothetical protein